MKVYLMIKLTSLRIPPYLFTFKLLAAKRRFLKVILLPAIMAKKVVKVIMPSPPIWIRMRITSCPQNVKACGVSTTINPVTHEADVDVNNASMGFIPEVVASGSNSNNVPKVIKLAKVKSNRYSGDRLLKNAPIFLIDTISLQFVIVQHFLCFFKYLTFFHVYVVNIFGISQFHLYFSIFEFSSNGNS